jgi:bacillithiol biosynthesis cysteine-adding enzyme BshC
MFKSHPLDFKNSGSLNPLVLDYLEKKGKTRAFYGYFPDLSGFKEILGKNPFKNINREVLHKHLLLQSTLVTNTDAATTGNIERLKNENAYAVTTGHQLCLFTGPLYFIYKVFSTINLAERLKKEFPENDFIPVYWLAGEDHDFEEVNHFNAFGKTVRWESDQKGSVGNFDTSGLKSVLPLISEVFGKSEHGAYLTGLFEDAYLRQPNLANATRYLVNALFGRYGLVTVDGNEPAFKKLFRAHFRQDILDNTIHSEVHKTIAELQAYGYTAQVNPRTINCFFMEKNTRERIENDGKAFSLVGSGRTFEAAAMEALIENEPEKISPNVVLRPVYQQVLLPNIAYVGGPGELAYWLEFKNMFGKLGVQFPVLVPRAFFTIVDKPSRTKMEKLSLSPEDFFREEQEIAKTFQIKSENIVSLEGEKSQVAKIYSSIQEKIAAADPTLSASVSAEGQKAMNGIEAVLAKANKALKNRQEAEMGQISKLKQKLFPNGAPQERHENFSSFYIKYGPSFLEAIKNIADPLLLKHVILSEE